ncbi:MAG TPA: family 16 glycoside hydrolase [Ktedonosporobacter sp.]|nr:family 16 glycoside hydrolase [Ktedonosporobacter sp.]
MRYVISIAVGIVLFLLAGCANGSPSSGAPSPVATAKAQPTVPSVQAGTVLYKADWSRGAGNWQLDKGWTVVNGGLQSMSTDNGNALAPYQPAIPNYAITVHFRALQVLHKGGEFTVIALKTATQDGYYGGVLGIVELGPHPGTAQSQIVLSPSATSLGKTISVSMSRPNDYHVGDQWHDYRVEVKKDSVEIFDNGTSLGQIYTVSDAASSGPIGIESNNLAIQVSSYTITAL